MGAPDGPQTPKRSGRLGGAVAALVIPSSSALNGPQ
jgi:hypothetical protein